MLSLGPLTLDSRLILAPLAGISDLAYRLLNRSFGCKFAFTEMISANALVYQNRQSVKMLSSTEEDRPLGAQILGSDPGIIEKALDILSPFRFDLLDFNAACPVKKVVTQGQGSGLLRDPEKLQMLLRVLVTKSTVPVTVKIRAGWDEQTVNAPEIARRAEDAGVQGIIVHGRTKMQGYSGTVDYEVIRRVKESVSIPVIASGDAFSALHIKRLFDETGCDGVAIARGALGNPWIFRETGSYLSDGTVLSQPDIGQITETMKEHLSLLVRFQGERTGVVLFRKFFIWYTRGFPVKELRNRAFHAQTSSDMNSLIDAVRLSVGSRVVDPEGRSFSRVAFDGDKSAIIPDYAVDDGKAGA